MQPWFQLPEDEEKEKKAGSLPPIPLRSDYVEPSAKPVDPVVKEYLLKKRAPAVEPQVEALSLPEKKDEGDGGLSHLQFLAGIGDAIAGRSSAQTASNFNDIRKRRKDDSLSDPNSQASVAFRKTIEASFPQFAKAYGDRWNEVSAADQDLIFKPLQLKETQDARKEAARLSAGNLAESREQRKFEREQKQAEKDELLQTTYGMARTTDDAKKIKDGAVLKKNFDAKLQELIDIRKAAGGGQVLDREVVTRAKQLSKDLLLDYKAMSQLGVLSQSDHEILNAIIPEDPTAYRGIVEAVQGQDSILSNLQKFKSDKELDFKNKLSEMLRNPPQESREPDVLAYAQKHGISYEEALAVKQRRTSQTAGK